MNNYNLEFQFIENILFIKLSGTFKNDILKDGQNVFQPLIDECKKNQCTKVIIDASSLQADLGVTELFRAGEDAAKLSRYGLRVAFLARNETIDSFFNNVIYNRGGETGVFTNRNAALSWLQK
jgi:hypothetical protein